MRVHYVWWGPFWLRHTIKARRCKRFATGSLCEKQGILLPKRTSPAEQRQTRCHQQLRAAETPCSQSAVLLTALGARGGTQFSPGAIGFAAHVTRQVAKGWVAHWSPPSTQTRAGGLCLDSRGERGPSPQATAWHTAFPLASLGSSAVSGPARGDGPCCPAGRENIIFSLPIPAAGFCYKPNSFQRVQSTI